MKKWRIVRIISVVMLIGGVIFLTPICRIYLSGLSAWEEWVVHIVYFSAAIYLFAKSYSAENKEKLKEKYENKPHEQKKEVKIKRTK